MSNRGNWVPFPEGPGGRASKIALVNESVDFYIDRIKHYRANCQKLNTFSQHLLPNAFIALETYYAVGSPERGNGLMQDLVDFTRATASYQANCALTEEILTSFINGYDEKALADDDMLDMTIQSINIINQLMDKLAFPIVNYLANIANVQINGRLSGFLQDFNPDEYKLISDFIRDVDSDEKMMEARQSKQSPPDDLEAPLGDF